MPQSKTESKKQKRHFTAVVDNKEQGLYNSYNPSSAAKKAVSKLCADDKKRQVEFYVRETTQDSNKKTYGPYLGYVKKLKEPIKLEGRVIKYSSVAKLSKNVTEEAHEKQRNHLKNLLKNHLKNNLWINIILYNHIICIIRW